MYIETQRLILRKFTLSDAEAVYSFSSNPSVSQYTGDQGAVTNINDAINIIKDIWLQEYENIGYARLALVEKESSKVIGFCGLKFLDDFQLPDLGYRMLPLYWGKGYATESASAVIEYAKNNFNIPLVMAMAMKENTGSQNVLLKLGFNKTREDIIDGLPVNIFELKLI